MLRRRGLIIGAAIMVSLTTAPDALADPEQAPQDPVDTATVALQAAPAPDPAAVPSGDPMSAVTPDGWSITVAGKDEYQQPVPPLTTAVSSREYLVGGTFTGAVEGAGTTQLTGGVLEAGYQIGCGIDMGSSNGVRLEGEVGVRPEQVLRFDNTGAPYEFEQRLQEPITGGIAVYLKPGVANNVPVSRKEFQGANPRITITGFHIKIDGCVGQSFIRSYATLTVSTADTNDVIAYNGVTKVV